MDTDFYSTRRLLDLLQSSYIKLEELLVDSRSRELQENAYLEKEPRSVEVSTLAHITAPSIVSLTKMLNTFGTRKALQTDL
mgnify:CR=1 FL=1